ncbi:hypothetical protein I4U23_003183 [Adineta vaga]|nr:hypothetical protein I4U23_003183 [Adineta vaga]
MRQPVRGNKKSAVQPVVIINENKFTPKVSERTIQKKQKAREQRLNPGMFDGTLNACGIICLYLFLIVCVLIGAGGIVVCIIYFNVDNNTQIWKIIGIVLGGLTCIIGIILILLSIFKQVRNRPWKSKKEEKLVSHEVYEDDDDVDVEDLTINPKDIHETKETASSPIPHPSYIPSKAISTEPIFQPEHISIAIQTEENKRHTVIDRTKKISTTMETQTNLNPDSVDNVFFRRVPVATAKVVVQQPATKVMIVRVPNTAGELIIQPPRESLMHDKK